MSIERKKLTEELASVQNKLKDFPSGKLFCTRNEGRYKWYHSDGHDQAYIPKRNRKLAEQLAAKKYLSLREGELLRELKTIDHYMKHCERNPQSSEKLLSDPAYKELLTPYFSIHKQQLSEWMNSHYDHNETYPEQKIHKTISGIYVRSKSEAAIAMCLYLNKIPFRYECALDLGEVRLYPDFTIRHPETGKFFYWEHFGLMDHVSYRQNVFSKMELYASHSIFPSVNLLTTYETKENPLNYDVIENMVKLYLL